MIKMSSLMSLPPPSSDTKEEEMMADYIGDLIKRALAEHFKDKSKTVGSVRISLELGEAGQVLLTLS